MMVRLLPLVMFTLLMVVLGLSLMGERSHQDMPQLQVLNSPMPMISAPDIQNPKNLITRETFAGKPVMINVFASWCIPCLQEHPVLKEYAKQKKRDWMLVGINWRESPDAGRAWLAKHGNPYDVVISDPKGTVGLAFGIHGVPETYWINGQGQMIAKYPGPVDAETLQKILAQVVP